MDQLIKKYGLKDVIISHYNDLAYKDHITLIISDDLAVDLVGKTYGIIPLSQKGLGKTIDKKTITKIFNDIRSTLSKEEK